MNRHDETNNAIRDLNTCLNLLADTSDETTKRNIICLLRCKIYDLYLINNLDADQKNVTNASAGVISMQNNKLFTKEELAKYNGRNGMPAFVAVNGTVYDVTNNAAWGAATHFGLSAGNDLTAQFASCHTNQPILQKLPAVGKMT